MLSKQLPLFFAELQMLDGGVGVGSDRVFGLYEITGRLGAMWDDLCPGWVSRANHDYQTDEVVLITALRLTLSLSRMLLLG